MYPFPSLPDNLAVFCARLRRVHAFRIGPRELQDAARALEVVPLADERAVRNALRPVLAGTYADVLVFDDAFRAFFYRSPSRPLDREPDDRRTDEPPPEDTDRPRRATAALRFEGEANGTIETDARSDAALGAGVPDDERDGGLVRSRYSPLDAEAAPPELEPADADWRAAARALLARLDTGLSRRWRPAARGRRFDLRRTLRGSLQTGAEVLMPRWRTRPRRRPRVVVLVDGSRSMSAHARSALQMTVALASVTLNLEAFTFSTALSRVTRDVMRAAAGERRPLPPLRRAWGGGTSIGRCLHEFVTRFGERLLGRNTVVVIVSDGLDVGAPDVLRQTMARLHRHSAAVVWLNPLLDLPGYEPTAMGMRAARPFVTTFACVRDAADLIDLSRVVRVRP